MFWVELFVGVSFAEHCTEMSPNMRLQLHHEICHPVRIAQLAKEVDHAFAYAIRANAGVWAIYRAVDNESLDPGKFMVIDANSIETQAKTHVSIIHKGDSTTVHMVREAM